MVNDTKEEQITRSKLNSTTGKLEYFKQLVMREDRIIISTDEGGTLAKMNTEKYTLREVSKYGVISGPYFPVFSPNKGKYRP